MRHPADQSAKAGGNSGNRADDRQDDAEQGRGAEEGGAQRMGRLIKLLVALAVAALLGLTVYAYLPGTLAPDQAEVVKPVTLNVDQ